MDSGWYRILSALAAVQLQSQPVLAWGLQLAGENGIHAARCLGRRGEGAGGAPVDDGIQPFI